MRDSPWALVDWAPLLRLLLLALLLALLPAAWVWLRRRNAALQQRLASLTALTLFLTFDLIVFGSFTRLSDSGLGCPDWPGCYGAASPWGAREQIAQAQAALPSGPVTAGKAWIEMIHRYLAMVVGVLILVMAAVSWRTWCAQRRGGSAGMRSMDATPAAAAAPGWRVSPWWPSATLLWVLVQGAFGKFTVTLKLYPLVVTLHLLGGLFLLALLACQHAALQRRALPLPHALWWLAAATLVLVVAQVALGGWVSTNYAVLACTGFPQCNGQWWPDMNVREGFALLRPLGQAQGGGYLPLEALVAVHMAHRVLALAVSLVVVVLAVALWRSGAAAPRRLAALLLLLLLLQVATGASNVVLGWPVVAALLHSAGAAALVLLLVLLLASARLAALDAAAADAADTAGPAAADRAPRIPSPA